jgi:hypothetical protein
MMLRRQFTQAILSIPFFGFISNKLALSSDVLHSDLLGKAISCTAETYSDVLPPYELHGHRYVSFPISTHVTVEFEKGEIVFTCYNVTKETHLKFINNSQNFIKDSIKVVDSISEDKLGIDTILFNNQKFKTSHIMYTGKV